MWSYLKAKMTKRKENSSKSSLVLINGSLDVSLEELSHTLFMLSKVELQANVWKLPCSSSHNEAECICIYVKQ